MHDLNKLFAVTLYPLSLADAVQERDERHINMIYLGGEKALTGDHNIMLRYKSIEQDPHHRLTIVSRIEEKEIG